jgi:hypothetical protein
MRLLLLSMICVLVMFPAMVCSKCLNLGHLMGIKGTAWNAECWVTEPADGGIMRVIVYCDPEPLGYDVYWFQFRVVSESGFTGVYVGETLLVDGTTWGNSQDGIIIQRDCIPLHEQGRIYLLEVQYMTYDTSAPCCYLSIGPYTGDLLPPALEVYDCGHVDCVKPHTAPIIVNPNKDGAHCQVPCVSLVPIQETTWGQIKELYNE